jgi:hypothetical protein
VTETVRSLLRGPGRVQLRQCLPVRSPESYGFHTHVLILHFRNMNRLADTIGVASSEVSVSYMNAHRSPVQPTDPDGTVKLGSTVHFDLVAPDSVSRTCTTTIQHLTGYQELNGGDTTRVSALESGTGWALRVELSPGTAALVRGDTVRVDSKYVDSIPDLLVPGAPLELEVTFDLQGLFYWVCAATDTFLRLDPSYVQVRQVLQDPSPHSVSYRQSLPGQR